MHFKLADCMAGIKFWNNHKLLWVRETGSTNDDLKAMWRTPDFFQCLKVADVQTSGRGQYDRKWESATAGQCLMFSFSVKVKEYKFPVSMIAGSSLAVALERIGLSKESFWLKWPNDIWVNGKKLAGILTESMCDLYGFNCVIGVGLNMKPVYINGETKAVSLQEEGIEIDRESLLCEFCKAWDEVFALSAERQAIIWNEYGGQFWKRSFKFDVPGREIFVGKPIRLESDGTLIVKASTGEEKIVAGFLLPA